MLRSLSQLRSASVAFARSLRTRQDYLNSLKSLKPNIYKFGRLIEDVTTDSSTKRTVESHARGIDAAHDPELADIFTTTSDLTGQTIHRNTSLMTSGNEMMMNSKFKREMYHLTGTCSGGLCVGWNAMNVMWSVTYDIDNQFGTDYHKRLKQWAVHFQDKGLVVAAALTDAKGDRMKKPHQQDLDYTVHIKEVRPDGVVISGCKAMICGVAACEEIFLLPGGGYGEADKDCAFAGVVKRDTPGLTIVEARHASDGRDLEEGFDNPLETGITQAWLFFDDCFIPNDRVFMAGEFKHSLDVILRFTAGYRACIGACVAGQGDIMVGAAASLARANGLAAKVFQDKITNMEHLNEVTYAHGIGAIHLGYQHESGSWVADTLTAHANKINVATLPYEVKRLCQEIGGGIAETGCMPSYLDFNNPQLGPIVQKFMKAGDASPESRARLARLVEWLTLGGGVPGCMHGGGSPDGAKMIVYGMTPLEKYAKMALKLAGVTEDIKDPEKPKPKAKPLPKVAPATEDVLSKDGLNVTTDFLAGLPEPYQLLKDSVASFVADKIEPIAAELDASARYPQEIIDEIGQMGLMGVAIPEKYGGAGMDYIAYSIALEEIAKGDAGVAATVSINNSLYCHPLNTWGTDAQKKKFLTPFANGEKVGSFGVTEPNAGSDVASMITTAVEDGDNFIINGSKQFITNSPVGHGTVVFATEDPAKKHRGITAFIVPRETPGYIVGKRINLMGINSCMTGMLHFEDCVIPKENVLGERGKGFQYAMATLDAGRIGIASQALGIAQIALERAVKYANERKQFGKPIAALPAIQNMIAEMNSAVDGARLLTWRAAAQKDTHMDYSKAAAMAKLTASEAATFCTHKAIQIMGGMGYTKETPMERHYRDARITEIYEGTSEIMKLVVSLAALKEFA
jgi:4-hydroxybutyryl-CoA dehydratase/vinylacetyl-CoA-Delta-isomerase